MSMDDVRMELPDGFPEFRNLPEISHDSLSVHAEILAFDALLFNGVNLLRDERGVMTILATSDDQNTHKINRDSYTPY